MLLNLIDIVVHLNRHLDTLVSGYGAWTYLILFLVIFAETGLVVTPFLPGDSLLFATGALAATSSLDVYYVFLLLALAAILGDTVNYWIGNKIGPRAFQRNSRFLRKEHLIRTRDFYERHGGKTIILARFLPIIRTFAPFVAGVAGMAYGRFVAYNIVGGIAWTGGFLFAGYKFGNLAAVQKNFGLVILGIIVVSVIPPVIEYVRSVRRGRRETRRDQEVAQETKNAMGQ